MENGSQPSVLNADTPIDPEFAIYAEDGSVIGQFDDDGNESFFEGKAPRPAAAAPVNPEPPVVKEQEEEKPAVKPTEKPVGEKPEESAYINHADFVLKSGGFEGEELELEDGTVVKISDLTVDQQLNLVTNEFVRMQEEFSAEIEERGKGETLTDEEKHLVEFLRNGGTARDLAKFITDNDPDNAHKNLTDDQLVLESIRTSMPGATEEDIQEEFSILKEAGRIEKRALLLRQKLGTGEIKLADISEKHRLILDGQRAKEVAVEIEDAKKLTDYSKGVKAIANVPVDPTVINAVLKDLIPEKPGDDSNFLKGLSDPAKLLRMSFLDKYAEQILEHVAQSSLKEGMELERIRLNDRIEELETQLGISKKHLSRFSDKPIIEFSKPSAGKKLMTEQEPEVF